jgi:hypothetical protein
MGEWNDEGEASPDTNHWSHVHVVAYYLSSDIDHCRLEVLFLEKRVSSGHRQLMLPYNTKAAKYRLKLTLPAESPVFSCDLFLIEKLTALRGVGVASLVTSIFRVWRLQDQT